MNVNEMRQIAWERAHRLCAGDQKTAGMVIQEAQLDVIRALISKTLPDGEANFWALVAKEIP